MWNKADESKVVSTTRFNGLDQIVQSENFCYSSIRWASIDEEKTTANETLTCLCQKHRIKNVQQWITDFTITEHLQKKKKKKKSREQPRLLYVEVSSQTICDPCFFDARKCLMTTIFFFLLTKNIFIDNFQYLQAVNVKQR